MIDLDRIKKHAIHVSQNSTCDRLNVGCVIFDDTGDIISEGWNSAPVGLPVCKTDGHLLKDGHCVRTIHAEQMAIINAAGQQLLDSGLNIMVTHSPCIHCIKLIIECEFKNLYYLEIYKDTEYFSMLYQKGIQCFKLD